jgi:hypothetical protein
MKTVRFSDQNLIKRYFLSDEERYDKQMCWFNITQNVRISYLTKWSNSIHLKYYGEDIEEERPPIYHFIGTTVFLIGSIAYYIYLSN